MPKNDRQLPRRKRVAQSQRTCLVEIIRGRMSIWMPFGIMIGINPSSFSEYFFLNELDRIRIFNMSSSFFFSSCRYFILDICVCINVASVDSIGPKLASFTLSGSHRQFTLGHQIYLPQEASLTVSLAVRFGSFSKNGA